MSKDDKKKKEVVLKSIKVREFYWKRAKKAALKEDIGLRDLIEKAIKEYLKK